MQNPAHPINPAPSATFRQIDNGGVLLDVTSGSYFELNEAGCFLWHQISAGTDEQSLTEALRAKYGISAEEATTDVGSFLEDLRARSLIRDSSPSSSNS